MKRYNFLDQKEIYETIDKVRDSFLAAKDGHEVNEIINGLLTQDEQLRIGRRVLIAEYLLIDMNIEEIEKMLKVGKATIASVAKSLDKHPRCFELLKLRRLKVKKNYNSNKTAEIGGSKLVFKKKEYTGFTRKDVKR